MAENHRNSINGDENPPKLATHSQKWAKINRNWIKIVKTWHEIQCNRQQRHKNQPKSTLINRNWLILSKNMQTATKFGQNSIENH